MGAIRKATAAAISLDSPACVAHCPTGALDNKITVQPEPPSRLVTTTCLHYGVGMCGACTVLVDRKPVSGCLILAEQVEGTEILTVEGFGEERRLHRIQQAFIDEGAFQCAYCTPGFLLSTVALLDENPNPSEDDIREYLSGNLCRCGSYQNIAKAVIAASIRD